MALSPAAGERLLIELSYDGDRVKGYRLPTVADAGLTSSFRPAREVVPHVLREATLTDWTKPTGSWPNHAGIVHDGEALSVLSRPPRLVGRLS